MIKRITMILFALILSPLIGEADSGDFGGCELRDLREVEGWEWLKEDSRFEIAQVCEYSDVDEVQSIVLYGPEKKEDGILYREYFVANDIKEEEVFKAGVVFPLLASDDMDVNWYDGEFITLQSMSNFDELVNVYENAILGLRGCMGSDHCVNGLLEGFENGGRCADDEYREFREDFIEIEDRQDLIDDVSPFYYDAETERLSFDIKLPENTYWNIEFELLPTGEVGQMVLVCPVTI